MSESLLARVGHGLKPFNGVSPHAGIVLGAKTPAEAAEGKETVEMVFVKPVHLTVTWGCSVLYPIGTHPVPREIAGHPFLQASGARLLNPLMESDGEPNVDCHR